jgi:hypothetical protein
MSHKSLSYRLGCPFATLSVLSTLVELATDAMWTSVEINLPVMNHSAFTRKLQARAAK